MFFNDIVEAGAVEGHILIKDLTTDRILVNKRNKIKVYVLLSILNYNI